MKHTGGVVAAAVGLPLILVTGLLGVVVLNGEAVAACNPGAGPSSSVTIDPAAVPATTVAGYSGEQLVNAAYILRAGQDLDLGVRDQTIGVMTAMGESGLRILDHGDAVGPDSRGLFQQRDNGAWGSYTDRMDPYISATNFFRAMMRIDDRDSLPPTIVAHRTQRNADPYHYERYWPAAVEVVEALVGVDTGLSPGTGGQVCTAGPLTPGQVSTTGWAVPAAGPVTSSFGMRVHPIYKVLRLHAGTDLGGGGCNGPIWAAQNGVVVFAGFDSRGTGVIRLDHGSGVETWYLHERADGILVDVGDHVTAGQQIGRVGDSGDSTACHLHFEVHLDGQAVDPEPYMAQAGAPLR
ncbi:M23 family metallopeptidase [Antribacter gilvus]|uniref:M23 family metallopeptidase n=1 Tax=Antribacter gilvus TaxID=2304675 RepID=UPI000F77C8CB|nr:M23 family metallopeptidase [Antribacter gilvus]